MVNELRGLLRESAADAPHEVLDTEALLRGGRSRVRRRRVAAVAGAATATAVVVAGTSLLWPGPPDLDAAGVPRPDAPVLRVSQAREAVEGQDYRVLTSYTNEDLDRDNGQYLDGVTEDGLVLFRDGPRIDQMRPRLALLDPATGEKDWLPDPGLGQVQTWPVELGAERLVLLGTEGGRRPRVTAWVFDREDREWRTMTWPDLPRVRFQALGAVGPDGRLYVRVPATSGEPPPGGWPTGPDGEADDADAEGDTYRLWSVSLTDPSDVRDEELTVGDVDFTDSTMVWTDATNGDSGRVHVRDLASGEERAFDPRSGERCNLLTFGATEEHVVLGQYCGTYDGVRDDRVQVVGTDGEQVVTVQDSGIEGGLVGDTVMVTSLERSGSGTYVYDTESGGLLSLGDSVSSYSLGGPTPPGYVMWHTAENGRHGATQWVGRILD